MDIEKDFTQTTDIPTNPDSHAISEWKEMAEKLYYDLGILFQSELSLVRSEFKEKIADLRSATLAIGAGLALIFLSLFSLMATFILVLGTYIPFWASALGVTVLFSVVGFAMFKGGKEKIELEQMRPRHTIETLGEMKKIVKENYYEFKSGPKQ